MRFTTLETDHENPGWMRLSNEAGQVAYFHPEARRVSRVGLLVKAGFELEDVKQAACNSYDDLVQAADGE